MILAPEFKDAVSNIVETDAHRLTSEVLIAALIVDAKTGAMPTKVAQIPGQWIDPFSGKPLKLRAGKDSITIYSIGPAMEDLGGIVVRGKETKYNVAASYPPQGG